MSVLIRKYKLATGMQQEERIDDEDRIERYMKLFDREDVKKIQSGQKVKIEKDEWQLVEDQHQVGRLKNLALPVDEYINYGFVD